LYIFIFVFLFLACTLIAYTYVSAFSFAFVSRDRVEPGSIQLSDDVPVELKQLITEKEGIKEPVYVMVCQCL